MPRTSKKQTFVRKLKKLVANLKKAYLASLATDNDAMEVDNYLFLMYMIIFEN